MEVPHKRATNSTLNSSVQFCIHSHHCKCFVDCAIDIFQCDEYLDMVPIQLKQLKGMITFVWNLISQFPLRLHRRNRRASPILSCFLHYVISILVKILIWTTVLQTYLTRCLRMYNFGPVLTERYINCL